MLLFRVWLVLLGGVSLSTHAQGLQPLLEEGAFGNAYELVQEMEPEGLRIQMLATYYTLVGRQDLVYDLHPSLPLADACYDQNDASFFAASQWTEEALGGHQVVMINENHFHLASRAWVLSMHESFKVQGFTHIGFEALLPGQTQPEDGFYTQEPVFAALLTRAHDLGFEVFGYELNEQVPEGQSNFDFREDAQAKNIAAVIDSADSDARFLIFAGWSHIAKQPVGEAERLWMAARFMALTDTEPFSIDLVSCVYESDQDTNPKDAKVRLDSEGQSRIIGQFESLVDAQLHLPMATSVGFYRKLLGEPVAIPQSLRSNEEARLIRAFAKEDDSAQVPLDQVLLFAGENYPLYLKSGRTYELMSLDGEGVVKDTATIEVP